MASLPHNLVLMGDFNLHVESSPSDVRQLTGILESLNGYSIGARLSRARPGFEAS